jgi:hypothetical protein
MMINAFGNIGTLTSSFGTMGVMLPGYNAPSHNGMTAGYNDGSRFELCSVAVDVDLVSGGRSGQGSRALRNTVRVFAERTLAQPDPQIINDVEEITEDTTEVLRMSPYMQRAKSYFEGLSAMGKGCKTRLNDDLASNSPELIYAVGVLAKQAQTKGMALPLIRRISVRTVLELAKRYPSETLALLYIYEDSGFVTDENRADFESIKEKVAGQTFPGQRIRQSLMLAKAYLAQDLLKQNTDDSITKLASLVERRPYCFGFLAYAAVVNDNVLAKAHLRQLAETSDVHGNRARQILANFV